METLKNKEESADVSSLMKLANAYFIGNGVEEDEEKAFELFLQVYELGCSDSEVLLRLGQCYFNGYGTDKDTVRGVEFLKAASDAGSVDASFFLGRIYAAGNGIEPDLAQACSYYEIAAQAGDAPAMVELGRLYKSGRGVAEDCQKAAQLFQQASGKENAEGMVALAACYMEGCGVQESREESDRLLMKAAELGNSAAQYSIGCNYYKGESFCKDVEEAEKWLRASAEQGHEEAVGVVEHLLSEQGRIEEMFLFLEAQAKKGSLFALFRLGVRYWTGDQVEKNLEYAMDCWEEGSARGSASCSRNLGLCYRGDEIEENLEAAILWFQRAAEQGSAEALRYLGFIYGEEGAEEYDPERAAEFYKQAVEGGDAPAAVFLSFMYREDGVLGADPKLAYFYAEKAYELGYDNGAYLTGLHLFYGDGVERNRVEGIRRLNLAREMGHQSAEDALMDAYASLEPEHPLAEEAFRFFQEQAASGNGTALGILGQRSFDEGDYEKAVGYWERAAERGNTKAEQSLGKIYLYGQGEILPDKVRGAAYMKSAADKGDAVAQIFTAFCYEKGDGVEEDGEKAFQYMTKASDAGDASAHFFLGEYYEKGVGTQPDAQKAEELFRMVAVSSEAMDSMREMTQKALAGRYLDEGRFADLYALHMELGDSPSAEVACCLGKAYQFGCGTEKDINAARDLYMLAVRLGHEEAEALLEALDTSDGDTEGVDDTIAGIQADEKEAETAVVSKTVKKKGPWLAIGLLVIVLGILVLVIKGSGNSVQRASEYEATGTLWETTEFDDENVFGETVLIRDAADDYVNLREGPGTEYDIITSLPNGSWAQLGEGVWDDRWTYVMCEGNVGWVHSDFVHDLSGVIRNNSNTGCNVRQGPGTDYDIIGYLYNGEYVVSHATYDDEGWFCIEYDGGIGWISGGFWHDGMPYVYNADNEGANFRAEPNTESDVLAFIYNDTPVIPTGALDEGEWVHVQYDGMLGWVYRDFIRYLSRQDSLEMWPAENVYIDDLGMFDETYWERSLGTPDGMASYMLFHSDGTYECVDAIDYVVGNYEYDGELLWVDGAAYQYVEAEDVFRSLEEYTYEGGLLYETIEPDRDGLYRRAYEEIQETFW